MVKNTWSDWHEKSQLAIVDGNLSLALDCEIAAINALAPTTQQRTLGITVVSACAIACRGKDFERLNKIADQWFGEIPEYFQVQVASILTDATGSVPEPIKMLATKRIQDLINGILDTIDRSDFDHLAANWDDLSCTEVKATEDGWEAIVEEACPIDRSIAEWIEGQLFDRGWANVTVKTEW